MKSLSIFALMAGLIVSGCTGGSNNNPGNSQVASDNPTDSGEIATFTMKKSALKASFDASGVSSPGYNQADILVRWDFTNDGTFDTDWSDKKVATYTYPADGTYTVAMEMKDPGNQTDSVTKQFTIKATNTPPTAVFNVNIVKGMTASVDASSSSDAEDALEDLRVRWDWNGDNVYDTDWQTVKTAEHTYSTAGEYTINFQVKDLNDAAKGVSQKIIASPITIRNGFLTYGKPYRIQLHFRMINNLTEQPVTPADVPALTRAFFTISEDGVPIDLSETNQLLYNGKRPMFMVLLLDFTGSMYDAGAVIPMIDAANAFIDSQGDNNYISLWAFYERQDGNTEIDDFTRCTPDGKAKLQADLDTFAKATRDRGATEIWDVLAKIAANKFPNVDTGVNRGIVFLSDGHDTTSTTSLATLIDTIQKKATFVYSVGMAFRSQEYPADEGNLKKIADETGGLYFTVNQLTDLSTVFTQLSEDVAADWALSYITLKSTGTPIVTTTCNYLDGYAIMKGKFSASDIKGDVKQGLLVVFPALDSPPGQTEYTLYAGYVPRNISTLKIKVTSTSRAARLTLYDKDGICMPADGWTISPDVANGQAVPPDGRYTIYNITPLEYGAWGKIAKLIVDAPNLPAVHLDLPTLPEQVTLYGDKTIVFAANSDVSIDVP